MSHPVRKSLTALAVAGFITGCAGGGGAGVSTAPPLSREAAATAANVPPYVTNAAPVGAPGIAQLGRPVVAAAGDLNNELYVFGSKSAAVLGSHEVLPSTSIWAGPAALPPPLGAFISSRPAVAANALGLLDVLVRDSSSAALVHSTNTPGGAWLPFVSLGGPAGGITSDPVVSLDGNSRLEAFALGSPTSVWVRSQTAPNVWGAAAWKSLGAPPSLAAGGGITSDPAVYLDVNQNLELFVAGLDNRVWYTTQIGGSWPGTPWKSMGIGGTGLGAVTGDPTVIINNNSTLALDVFARGDSAALLHSQQNPGGGWPAAPVFSSLNAPPGGVASDPAAEQNTLGGFPACIGCLAAFVTNGTGVYYTHQATPGVWAALAPWIFLGALPGGAAATSAPTVVHNTDGRLEVFVRSSIGNELLHKYQIVGGTWSAWNPIGGGFLNDAVL